MLSGTKYLAVIAVIVLAVILQVFLAVTENADTPADAAVAFAKAYYKQDSALSEKLCQELLDDEEADIVTDYINRVADNAAAAGYAPSWMRMSLGHVETETQLSGENEAEVRIQASMRRNINPLYAVVARIFFLGETYHIDETVNLVKEDSGWKVCGDPLALTNS